MARVVKRRGANSPYINAISYFYKSQVIGLENMNFFDRILVGRLSKPLSLFRRRYLVNAFKRILSGELLNWDLIKLIPKWGLVLIAGATGSGKSTLAYSILEFLHYDQPNRNIYVYGFPEEKVNILPEWIQPLDTLEFPEGSIVLVDEAYIQFHSRSSMSQKSKFMDMFAGLVRQKDILGIFISQTLRKIDVGILSSSQLILVKKISSFQVKMDRSEMRSFLSEVLQAFRDAEEKGYDPQHCVYAVSNEKDFEGLIINSNGEPSFWSTSLSKAWSGVKLNDIKE